MNTIITINGITDSNENYITWCPAPAQIQLMNAGGAADPAKIRLRNQNPGQGRQLIFFLQRADEGLDELELDLPTNGSPSDFFVAGKFDRDNNTEYDAAIEVIEVSSGNVLSTTPVFIRVRRDADKLSSTERDLFLSAFGRLNNAGNGVFQQFRDMHVEASLPEAHGFPGFLPWHRAYLLDLERELQKIEPRVSLHYWRFDLPAPRLFSKDFIGVEDANGTVEFSSGHPLEKWTTDGIPGINRKALFNTQLNQASGILGVVISELATFDIGKPDRKYQAFRTMEGQPHGAAHLSFDRSISSVSDAKQAARDPLFFLLHANVDRLWALWQFLFKRFDINSPDAYSTVGALPRIGHNLQDTMWPWNQMTGNGTPANPRPPNAPGGNFPDSLIVAAPGLKPRVRDMIDYQGVFNAASWLGFGYDDVPYRQQ